MVERAPGPTGLTRLVRLVGLVGTLSFLRHTDLSVVVLVLVGAGAAAWLVWAVIPARWPGIDHGALVVLVLCGGATVAQFDGSAAMALVAVFVALAVQRYSIQFGAVIAVLAAVAVSGSALVAGMSLPKLLGILGGVAVVSLLALSRRQFRVTAEQNRLLVAQSRQIRDERDRAAALAERGRIAREVHDVLAHTLGGLVLQLDAADALLEACQTGRAAEKVRSSRELAAAGLADARRVVGALRAESIDLSTELEALAAQHRDSGGRARLRIEGSTDHLGEQLALALQRAAQESLTNARKHAPDTEVTLHLLITPETVALTATNSLPNRTGLLSATGLGAGLLGMRERIGALGGTVDAGKVGDTWSVRVSVPRR
ncbi:sensor histidine kinase [Nocardia panacis]|nr:histidine kinase [Nocardia panacis]